MERAMTGEGRGGNVESKRVRKRQKIGKDKNFIVVDFYKINSGVPERKTKEIGEECIKEII